MKYQLHLLSVALAAYAASPPVHVSLKSQWKAPPALVELIETFALEDSTSFFPLLDLLTNREVLPSTNLSPEGLHQATVEIATSNGLVDPQGSLEMAEMNLAMHAATPKIEAFYNYYETHYNNSKGSQCGSWVDWYGDVVCDVETLAHLAGVETIDSQQKSGFYIRPRILTFDHVYPSSELLLERPHRTAVLYASLSSPNFRELHEYLYKLSSKPNPHVEYVLRHIPPTERNGHSNTLSGYGVGLDLKKMDYLAVDDRLSKTAGKQEKKGSSEEEEAAVDPIMSLIDAYPASISKSDAQLSEAEFTAFGPQAVQLIADSKEPLEALIALSQDFPKYAKAIPRRVIVNESITRELHENGQQVQPGMNIMWVNGGMLDGKETEPLGLLRQLKKERAIMGSLESIQLSRTQSIEVLTHPAITASQRKGGGVTDGLFDASDRQEGGGLIVYWNDFNKDKRYSGFGVSLFALLRPSYPGQFPSIKGNLFNVILALDLSKTENLHFMIGPMSNILERKLPFRFGVVPIAETEDGTKMARLFYHLIEVFGRKKTLEFLKTVSESANTYTGTSVHWPAVEDAYDQLLHSELSENPDTVKASFSAVIKGNGPTPIPLEKLEEYHKRLGTTLAHSETGSAFFNGKPYVFDGQFLRNLQADFGPFQQYYQEAVYGGVLSDKDLPSIGEHLYDLPTTSKRRSLYIFPKTPADLRLVNLPEAFSKAGLSFSQGSYLYSDSDAYPLSVWVVGDFDSEGGLDLVKEALDSFTETSNARLSFIANPRHVDSFGPESRSALLSALSKAGLLKNWSSKGSLGVLKAALGLGNPASSEASQVPLLKQNALDKVSAGIDFSAESYAASIKSGRIFLKQLSIEPGQLAVVVNGRVVAPITPGSFKAGDFEALEGYELRKRAEPVIAALKDIAPELTEDKFEFANQIAFASSVISKMQQPDPSESGLLDSPPKPRHRNYNMLASDYTVFEYGNNRTALYHIAVIVDPLSDSGQKWSSMLKWLSNIPDVFIKVYLNPGPYTNLPLKRHYRYNLLTKLQYDVEGQEIPVGISFKDLHIEPIYTLAMDVPSSWLVRPRESLYDLDNIQLGQLLPQDDSVTAIFSLDALILDGHAREAATQSPPRGVQLQLASPTSGGETVPIQDTLVMANLGYFQFRVAPGVFNLEIREGRGRKIYAMESVGGSGWHSPTVEEDGSEVALTSFEGVTLFPRLTRQPGMEQEDVLAEPEEGNAGVLESITAKVFGMFKSKKTEETGLVPVKKQAEINIFTVASGLLYERFASIMILSVLRNTNHTVKFWFIENFLSPSFLEFIPQMAAEYGFDYELVTYKWPSWLRAQSEKQRIIWAYKILFLDVLFPMDLKKVIFVDADQIVRADLKELVDLDLHGAPYAYTPMGDDNTDMEGFRFWKTGYWKSFLEGRPYHISALYVIDLVKFRQMAAGDILRQQYQALSADPNSLANLDQDLPNNLQGQVPIYSLPEDWLWCETWCSKDRLHKAKTIDLCQNPLTKEPKLARARQIPEWEEYDTEIANFTRRLAEQGRIRSGLATADTNVLAGGASEKKEKGGATEKEATSEPLPEEVPRDEL
ncbi:hypothetical protein D9611_010543 [Ephemerocybe angulata]|uniref:Glycosyltransferase family 24 protein n=1 Tax=Ephemerocybe angulata TaxID=980116 RepID=A0A8H5BVR0_9AGAR|nr:hypothetical protein D9611_010543 [Tulosesus angulatus]